MTVFNEYEQRQIAEAIARAEQRTDAELVTVLARRADDYAYLPLLWAALLALAIPGLAHMALGWPDLRSLLVVRSDVRRPVPAAAQSTFGQPPGPAPVASAPRLGPGSATVSRAQLATHRRCYRGADLRQRGRATCGDPVDEGIARHLPEQPWDAIIARFTEQVCQGQTLQGFVDCIEACGELLSEHVPPTFARNELPNRLVIPD